MHLLSSIRDLFVNFLFPRSSKVLELETFSAGVLLEALPRAESLKDKHTMALFNYRDPLVKEIIWEFGTSF